MSDNINARLAFTPHWEIKDCWLAFRLEDGSSDGTLYDTRADALRFQLHPELCAYFCFRNALGGVNPHDCQLFMDMHREAYDHGMGLHDPDAPRLIISSYGYDRMSGRRY